MQTASSRRGVFAGGPRFACCRASMRVLLFFLLFFSLLFAVSASFALPARAAEPPIVYHSSLPDHSNPGIHALASGTTDLELWLAIGSVASEGPGQTVCVDGGGDEICGFTLAIEASGGVSIAEFCPNGQCAPDLVHHVDPATGILRINRLGPAIDAASSPFSIGRLRVAAIDAGELRVRADSEAVSARLQILGVRDSGPLALALPEPGMAAGLALGIGLLASAARARRRSCGIARCVTHRAARRVPRFARGGAFDLLFLLLGIALAVGVAGSARTAAAQLYTDEFAFSAAVSGFGFPPARLGFETVPLTPAGFAGLGQDVRFGPVTLRSRSLSADLDLAYFGGVPLGLPGTLLVADPTLSGDPALHPGGTASGSGVRANDDVRIVFDVPMRAAGLRILENVAAAGESAIFLDVQGQVVATAVLPGGAAPGASGFVGYVIQPGDAPIKAIEIEESATDSDDIALDEIRYASSADPFADFVAAFDPAIASGEPIAPNLEADRSLGPPNLQSVSLGAGGEIVVQFTDNTLTGSDDARPDLRIFEADADLEGSLVFVSGNGADWTAVGLLTGGVQTIDLDAYGLDSRSALSFVRIVDDPSQGPATGPAVGADIDAVEALSGTWLPQDGDGDRVPDDYDVCPSRFDEAQRDDDLDGIGNACDNCRHHFNPGQEDADLDGEGNACEPARIRLIREFDPVPFEGKARLAELRIDCGGYDVESINLGIWVPPGPAFFDFGGNCDAPPPGAQPPGAPTGSGCTGPGILVGPTVQAGASGAFGVPLGDPMPPSWRPDVVFVTLHGAVANGGKLCGAFQTDVFLGRLRATLPLGLSPDAVASISLEDGILRNWCLVEELGGACAERSNLAYRMEGTLPLVAEVRLQPAAGQTSTAAVDWDVCIAETTVSYMHRVTVGLLGPVDAAYPTLLLDDCLVGPNASGKRSCAGEVGTDPEWVDESVMFTQGPLVSSLGDLIPDTLYAPLEGGAPGTGNASVLNPYLSRDACVGIVTNGAPPATLGAPPIPVRDGFFDLDYHDAGGAAGPQPYQTADDVLESLDGASVYETIVFNSGDDIDGDGFTDPVDNCPFAANPDQSDDGGLLSSVPNGHGNACECGDANGSGRVVPSTTPESGPGGVPLAPDLQLIREYLVGLHPGDPTIPRLCSVHGDTACNAADAVVLERFFAGLPADPDARCDAAVD